MIFKSHVFASASGSVAGLTYSRNRGGQYTRARAIPTNPDTIFQQNARAALAANSQDWAGLTDVQRQAWREWAKQNPITNALGDSITLSGHQAFVGINARLDSALQPTLTDPPIVNAPAALNTLVLTGDIGLGGVEVAFTETPLGATEALHIEAAVVNSAGITYVRNLLRHIGESAAAQASPFDIKTLVETRLGTLVVGQTLHVSVAVMDFDTGLLSPHLRAQVVVTTT